MSKIFTPTFICSYDAMCCRAVNSVHMDTSAQACGDRTPYAAIWDRTNDNTVASIGFFVRGHVERASVCATLTRMTL